MTQREIIRHYEDNGGLRCKYWSLKEIKDYIKADFGSRQIVYWATCRELKRTAEMYQH
mgnify:CR=1 FL=1